MNNCAICGQPLNFIKAGVSKTTGRPYNGFYACADKNHRQPRATAPQTPVQQFNQSLDQNTEDTKWAKINKEKEENIRWCNALNNATLLIAHNPVQGATDQDIITRLYMIAVKIDKLSQDIPTVPQSIPASAAVSPVHRALAQNNEEPVDLDSIPF